MGANQHTAKMRKPERLELVACMLAQKPFASAHEIARELASQTGVSERQIRYDVATFLDGLRASRGKNDGAFCSNVLATENLVQQIIDGRTGNAGGLLRHHALMFRLLDSTDQTRPPGTTDLDVVSELQDPAG